MDAEQMENGALGLRMLAEKEHGCSIGLSPRQPCICYWGVLADALWQEAEAKRNKPGNAGVSRWKTGGPTMTHEGHRVKTTGHGTRYCRDCQEWLPKLRCDDPRPCDGRCKIKDGGKA